MSFVGVLWWKRSRPPAPVLATTLMLGLASANVIRLVPLFIVAAVLLLSCRLRPSGPSPVPFARTIADASAVGAAVLALFTAGAIPRCIPAGGFADPTPPEALKASGATGRLVTSFNWGEYAIWHLAPDLRVSIDGRRETVYSMATLEEQNAIAFGTPEGIAALSRLQPEYVWLPYEASRATAEWLAGNNYRIDVETDRSFLAVRADRPRVTPVRYAATGCFPGP
jgi:hypothetical protein